MSIERMKRLWVVTDRERLRPLLDALASLQSVHLIETPSPEGPPGEVSRRAADASSAELLIARLQHALEIFNAFDPPKRSLGETFLPLPVEMGESEFRQALEGLDPEALDDALTRLVDDHLAMSHRIEEIRIERDHLKLWEPFNPTAPKPFHDLAAVLGSLNPRSSRQEESCSEADGDVVVNVLGRARDNRALVQVVALKEHQAEFDETLRRCEIEPLPLTPGVSVRDMLAALAEELEGLEKRVSAITHEIRALAETRRRDVQAVLTHWETAREVLRAHELAVDTRHTVVVTGYVRAREADAV